MTLDSLERLESFALLGPGFGNGSFVLLQGLQECSAARDDSHAQLVFASYGAAGREARIFEPSSISQCAEPLCPALEQPIVRFEDAGIRQAIDRIREAIAAGDVYQVCFTVRAKLDATCGSALLSAMCAGGAPRFAAWVRLPGGPEFVSASPECFFEVEGRRVRSEPMKGTAAPGQGANLESSAKDISELAMITDLVRNDLTRVCEPRSVKVSCARRKLELPYAIQMVSDVEGVLRKGNGPLEVLDALHPGGSVTGAPKESALEMIRLLESTPRGPYCGALGLWQGDHAMFSLLIRTASRTATGWEYGVGSGIVWDSDADAEVQEFRTKLGALGCGSPP
jgi:anthranilate/para-aminobenzoate synthase component I